MNDDDKVVPLNTGYCPDPQPLDDLEGVQTQIMILCEEIEGLSKAINGLGKLVARLIKQGQR